MKILHTADIHLGDLTGPVRDGKNARRQDTIACMKYIAQRAATETPNVTIIAGDLFNRSRVWADTALDDVNDAITEFIRPLCRSSEHVVLLFGTENHDNPRAFETVWPARRPCQGRGQRAAPEDCRYPRAPLHPRGANRREGRARS